jgi:hypothetical protein
MVFVVLAASGAVLAGGYSKVFGSYMIASKNITDPAPNEKKDRVAFFLDSSTAKSIYSQMPALAKKDACSSDLVTKTAGGLVCSRNLKSSEYQCTFGVMLKNGITVDVRTC